MHWIAFALALVVMIVGIVGTFLPALPGLPVIWAAMLVYGFVDRFDQVGWGFLITTLLVVVGMQFAEHYAKAWGARRFGAGKAGAWGAFVGSIAGLFFMPIGLVLGPFLGALLFELIAGREAKDAVKAGIGGVVGVLGSVLMNVLVGLGLTIAFVLNVIF
jgi:uncharacterized protein YqgC (DUF456 family)